MGVLCRAGLEAGSVASPMVETRAFVRCLHGASAIAWCYMGLGWVRVRCVCLVCCPVPCVTY